jgi:hypothetical protein
MGWSNELGFRAALSFDESICTTDLKRQRKISLNVMRPDYSKTEESLAPGRRGHRVLDVG